MRDKLTDMLRMGKISSVNSDGTAQVTFPDREDVVSGNLHVMQSGTSRAKTYCMPSVGDVVRVLFDPESPSTGCIIGSFYTGVNSPPTGDANRVGVEFSDGAVIEYNIGAQEALCELPAGTITLEVGGTSKVVVTDDSILLDVSGTSVEVKAGTITLKGEIIITGDMKIEGDITQDGEHTDSIGQHV